MGRSLRVAAAVVAVLAVVVGAAAGVAFWKVKSQGVPSGFWETFQVAKVRFDGDGIPTIEADDWETMIQAQGYVVASERLWQMDLIRRKAGGRLAEWFGEPAYEHDERVQREDRIALTRRGAEALPADEREYCETYAKGVNAFIAEHPKRWGIEYALLGVEPEPWTCGDTLLVVLEMVDVLTSVADGEAQQWAWRRHLSPGWSSFLFTMDHPWNRPQFGTYDGKGPALPPLTERLPMQPLGEKQAAVAIDDPPAIGSNNWVYRGAKGTFLANDPHLNNAVPSIWFAQRLRVSADDWAVGVAIPGLPGLMIGMNPGIAWAFTNTGEDIDDYLKEELSADGSSYLERRGPGGDSWQPVRRKSFRIRVKGEAEPRTVEGRFTHRGPLSERKWLSDGVYSRQWLALQDGFVRVPSVKLMQAQNWTSFNVAIDDMRLPAQNALFASVQGDIGYRTTGTGVLRRISGRMPQPAVDGEWLGIERTKARRRVLVRADEAQGQSRFLATANERIWVDKFGHNWWHEDRKERIARVLGGSADLQSDDMTKLHQDVESRFRKELMQWLAKTAPRDPLVKTWAKWDGSSRSDPRLFALATAAEAKLAEVLLGRVKEAFLQDGDKAVPYSWPLKRAWIMATLAAPDDEGFNVFGLRSDEVARAVLKDLAAKAPDIEPHQITNRWRGQHPFVGRVPVVGRFFAIGEPEQWGASDTVNAEQPNHGASLRMVWDMLSPRESRWIFPIGQSGHLGSPYYASLQDDWFAGRTRKVFDDGLEWNFLR